ncbi:Hypothetical_protein [Hexamita inflata]|uniref:Hypothetical_protein n=1 Tax=Hexamita inflata TaxID=28002 RepID=A0ABP1HM06_9EUKA
MERLPLFNPEGSLTAAQHFELEILPSATDLAETHLMKWDAARNEKRNRMNPSSITLNKAGISAMPLQLQRRNAKPNRAVQHIEYFQILVYIFDYVDGTTRKYYILQFKQILYYSRVIIFQIIQFVLIRHIDYVTKLVTSKVILYSITYLSYE